MAVANNLNPLDVQHGLQMPGVQLKLKGEYSQKNSTLVFAEESFQAY